MTAHASNVALFIDADNAPSSRIVDVLEELKKTGKLTICKAYGNWRSPYLDEWRNILHDHAIQPVQQFDLTKGKNSTDIAMTIDAMDVMYTKSVDVFCIMSSDCDFTPLAMRLRAEGKEVIGFGEKKTRKAFMRACSRFVILKEVESSVDVAPQAQAQVQTQSKVAPVPVAKSSLPQVTTPTATVSAQPVVKRTRDELNADKGLINVLRKGIKNVSEPGVWVLMSKVGVRLQNVNYKAYGFKKLYDLLSMFDFIETRRTGTHPEIRLKA